MKLPRVRVTVRFLMATVAGMAVLFAAAKWWASHYPITVELMFFDVNGGETSEVWTDGTTTSHRWSNTMKVRVRKYPFVVLEEWSNGTTSYRLNGKIP